MTPPIHQYFPHLSASGLYPGLEKPGRLLQYLRMSLFFIFFFSNILFCMSLMMVGSFWSFIKNLLFMILSTLPISILVSLLWTSILCFMSSLAYFMPFFLSSLCLSQAPAAYASPAFLMALFLMASSASYFSSSFFFAAAILRFSFCRNNAMSLTFFLSSSSLFMSLASFSAASLRIFLSIFSSASLWDLPAPLSCHLVLYFSYLATLSSKAAFLSSSCFSIMAFICSISL
mmetsp:Transcript_15501/g.31615  ORF Transcript_15501/g.31615 Transcript_15501/m.31615 type:complete len:231 (+) Transcript_15501:70-762(+)